MPSPTDIASISARSIITWLLRAPDDWPFTGTDIANLIEAGMPEWNAAEQPDKWESAWRKLEADVDYRQEHDGLDYFAAVAASMRCAAKARLRQTVKGWWDEFARLGHAGFWFACHRMLAFDDLFYVEVKAMTTTPTITQADRDAAADYYGFDILPNVRVAMREGRHDNDKIVQLLARHREQTIAALTNPSEAMAKLAVKEYDGGLVKTEDSANPRGYVVRFEPVKAMTAALSAAAAFIKDEQNG